MRGCIPVTEALRLLRRLAGIFAQARSGFVVVLALMVGPAAAGECVVLLHGLGRGAPSLWVMQAALVRAGYRVVNHGYDSTGARVEALAPQVGAAVARCGGDGPVHLVTHSMGGILARLWLRDHDLPGAGRVVMLAPPNQGSPLVDLLGRLPGYGAIMGPAGAQLGQGADSVPLALGPVAFDLGVIAGEATANPLASRLIPGPDDGKVAVADTRVACMADHIILPVTHTFMMNNPTVIAQTLFFLRNGRFVREHGS